MIIQLTKAEAFLFKQKRLVYAEIVIDQPIGQVFLYIHISLVVNIKGYKNEVTSFLRVCLIFVLYLVAGGVGVVGGATRKERCACAGLARNVVT